MSDIGISSELPHDGISGQARHISALAVTALVLSAIFCCPLTTVAGVIVGVFAIFVVGKDATLSGKWMAVVAVLLGIAATLLQLVVGIAGYNEFIVPIMQGPQTALIEGNTGNVEGFRSHFAVKMDQGNTPENAKDFLAELQKRYGEFKSSSIEQGTAPSQAPASGEQLTADYSLEFAKGRMRATCTVQIQAPTGGVSMKLLKIVIHDATLGDLEFPPADKGASRDGK